MKLKYFFGSIMTCFLMISICYGFNSSERSVSAETTSASSINFGGEDEVEREDRNESRREERNAESRERTFEAEDKRESGY